MAGRGVLVVVVVEVVVFAVVVLEVLTLCGRSNAGKQREEVGGIYWGDEGGWKVSLAACTALRLLGLSW